MSEFYDMLKEAMVGAEPYEPDSGQDAIVASVRKFERRMRTVRVMATFAVSFATVVMVIGIALLATADDNASIKELMLYAGLALWGFSVIGFGKMWFAQMINHIAIMKELKAIQLRVLDVNPEK